MLANDSNEGKNQSEFFLVIRPHQAVAELMAECPSCGAITSFALELAWQLDVVSCTRATAPCASMHTTSMVFASVLGTLSPGLKH